LIRIAHFSAHKLIRQDTSSLLEQQDLCKNRERWAVTMMNDNTWLSSHYVL
jgi:hypothetical protein